MHDFNELLPEEKAYPGIVQDLRTTYQLKPQEQRVLERVRQRLTQPANGPLSLEETEMPLSFEEMLEEVPLPAFQDQPHISHARAMRTQFPRWNSFNTLVAVLVCCVLIGTLAIVFGALPHNQTIGGSVQSQGISFVLTPTNTGNTPSQAALDATRNTLLQRFANFGLQGSSVTLVTTNGKPQFKVTVPHFGGDEQQTIDTLTGTGMLAFWDTNTDLLLADAHFDSSRYTQYNAGGKPAFTGQDIDPHTLSIGKEKMRGSYVISFSMKGEARDRFSEYTGKHIGSVLTITLDNRILISATIQSQITGVCEIAVNYTRQQAQALVASLKAGMLALPLQRDKNVVTPKRTISAYNAT